jgi:serine/threonine protein kinase/Flp pilus assembly protein TadD
MEAKRWGQIKEIYDRALDLSRDERESFLAEACAADPALHAEVDSLLRAHEQAGSFLDEPVCELGAESTTACQGEGLVGQALGHYQLVGLLGRGGMGEVYSAQDTRLNRMVALKILSEGMATDQDRMRRFTREAKAASALKHPNVATIYDIGKHDGTSFIAMEYIEGKTLAAKISGRPLDVGEIVEITIQVADALGEAQSKGVTHRDIKPSNIMLTPRGQVKVLDFGLAKITRPEWQAVSSDISTASRTETGVVMGTAPYMSPEQALGQEVDHRSDIFSLGVLTYEMTAGRRPFTGASATEIIDRILHAQPEPIVRYNEHAPAELERIVNRCLEKVRERRYQSAGELLQDLKKLRRELESGAAVTVAESRERERRLRLLRCLLAISTLVALVAGIIYLLLLRTSPTISPNIRSVAVLPLENLSGDSSQDYFADGMTDEMIANLGKIGALRVTSRTSVMQYKGVKKPLSEIARALNVEGVIEGSVKRVGQRMRITAQLIEAKADRQLWSESYERDVQDILALQDEIARAIAEAVKVKLAPQERMHLSRVRSVDPEAQDAYFKGRYHARKRNEEGLRTAITYYQEAIAKDKLYPHPHIGLADAYHALSTFMVGAIPPAQSFPKVEAAAQAALALDETLAEGHTFLAVMRLYRWEWREAEQGFKRALELNPSHALAHLWYSLYLASQERLDEARAEAKRAREFDPLSPYILQNVAFVAYLARQYDETIEYSRQALELDPNYVWARWRLGMAYVMQSRFEEAIEECERAANLARRSPPALSFLGYAYGMAGRRGEAQRVLNELVEMSHRTYVSPFSFYQLHVVLGRNDQALEWLEKAIQSHLSGMIFIRVNPELDLIRSDSRFKELVRRMGLSG